MNRIVIVTQWFGAWPDWMQLFVESCRWNPTVDFVIITDATEPLDLAPNVKLVVTTLDEYLAKASAKLGMRIRWSYAYKTAEMKPTLGYLHPELIEGYDFWGYCDIDVIFGDIRAIYTPEIFEHDLISSHEHITCGHLLLMRNDERMNTAFKRIRHWRWLLGTEKRKSFDERIFSLLFAGEEHRRSTGFHRFLAPRLGGALLREQFSTPLTGLKWIDGTGNFPTRWFWREGHLTTDVSGDREFLYLHFTHWASARWSGGDKAIWASVERLNKVTEPRPTSFMISANGFEPIPPEYNLANVA